MTILVRHCGAAILTCGAALGLVACGTSPPNAEPLGTITPTTTSATTTVPTTTTTTTPPLPPPTPPPVITKKPATTTKAKQPAVQPPPASNCDPSYPTVCIPSPPPDLNCGDIPFRRFKVLRPDPHNFDADRDGIGCETG